MEKKCDLYKMVWELECPFKEFRDNELSDFWSTGASGSRSTQFSQDKSAQMEVQVQPLPRSVMRATRTWTRASQLAERKWETGVVIYEDEEERMSVQDIQVAHAAVMQRCPFLRRVLSVCYMLERVEGFSFEHQSHGFTFKVGPEGWRPFYHIYSLGVKPGGGAHHRPYLSRNGWYLVRLYHLGAWRSVYVNDEVPLDAFDSPLLPFAPLKEASETTGVEVTDDVQLWPLLICKALLKVAAPDMNLDYQPDSCEDEVPDFDILHCLTGGLRITYEIDSSEDTWKLLSTEVPTFYWDGVHSANSQKIKKKHMSRENIIGNLSATLKARTTRYPMTSITVKDSRQYAPYYLPGITPGEEMDLLVTMIRDLPLKRPKPEPKIPKWKTYRWIHWARAHGLYEEYACPRTRYLKVEGLLQLSAAPHLLGLRSTPSINPEFREEQANAGKGKKVEPKKLLKKKPEKRKNSKSLRSVKSLRSIRSMRNLRKSSSKAVDKVAEETEWCIFDVIQPMIKYIDILYFPSMYYFASIVSDNLIKPIIISIGQAKTTHIVAPKASPIYLQVDSEEEIILRISLETLNPTVFVNSEEYSHCEIEPSYLLVEKFKWFVDLDPPDVIGKIGTIGYGSTEIKLKPGRHFCRLWIHAPLHYHAMVISKSALVVGSRDVVLAAAAAECPWASRYLNNIGESFSSFTRSSRSMVDVIGRERDFYKSYQPDLEWNEEKVGFKRIHIHWMFNQALHSLLMRKLADPEYRSACQILRRVLCDPNFGLPPKRPRSEPEETIEETNYCCCVNKECMDIHMPHVGNTTGYYNAPDRVNACPITYVIGDESIKIAEELARNKAATVIQAHWKGAWTRKYLKQQVETTSDTLKCIMDTAFANTKVLSELMNEFFVKFPEARSAYSVSSALTCDKNLKVYPGKVMVTAQCLWIPFFQSTFHCHGPVKVHFDIKSPYVNNLLVYDNDTGVEKKLAYSSHRTYEFDRNIKGYTVVGYARLREPQPMEKPTEVLWQLTVLTNMADTFHICDNGDRCRELPLLSATKSRSYEMYLPNRRNILCGLQVSVNKPEILSLRVAPSFPELKLEAVIRTNTEDQVVEVGRCSGEGELFWPAIRLEPTTPRSPRAKPPASHYSLFSESAIKAKHSKSRTSAKSSIYQKAARNLAEFEPKSFTIEVTALTGWPTTTAQWRRVEEHRRSRAEQPGSLDSVKKQVKEKFSITRNKPPPYVPKPNDAYVEVEYSHVGDNVAVRRDDDREQQFYSAVRSWNASDPQRKVKCAEVRKEFRELYLEPMPSAPSPSEYSIHEEEVEGEFMKEETGNPITPKDSDDDELYLTLPDKLRDKFVQLDFVPLCTREKTGDCIIMTPEMLEAAEKKRQEEAENALEVIHQLQLHNEQLLARQKLRCLMLERRFPDVNNLNPDLQKAFENRDRLMPRVQEARAVSTTSIRRRRRK
ncbi:LOW QUALITY PROTEIN: uncharacterized protein LOC121732740 [Aricia agestis]|uniref:LOW QUALITY PROTEIN: uncharacterized protein LOC121732740 n=1 Tax=Aricia agestis TaxID=91739 RepID=UPI001C2077F4|nr:LOW QUALITY PROTEIN: uncharacterized protein LOC121732740 [Aricia agestis]